MFIFTLPIITWFCQGLLNLQNFIIFEMFTHIGCIKDLTYFPRLCEKKTEFRISSEFLMLSHISKFLRTEIGYRAFANFTFFFFFFFKGGVKNFFFYELSYLTTNIFNKFFILSHLWDSFAPPSMVDISYYKMKSVKEVSID